MALDCSIYLIGYRGTGKSTVAKHLASRLDVSFSDADLLIERRGYRTIAEIFAEEGELAFRDLEQQVVADLAEAEPQVVALGGGSVLREANRQAISGSPVIWLQASPTVLAKRLAADAASPSQRPSLTGAGLLEEIEQVLAERTPIYRQCATLEVDTENRSPDAIAEVIYRELTRHEPR